MTTASGSQFKRIRVYDLRYDTPLEFYDEEFYDVHYSTEWSVANGTLTFPSSSCILRRTGQKFSGQCEIPGNKRFFVLSIDKSN